MAATPPASRRRRIALFNGPADGQVVIVDDTIGDTWRVPVPPVPTRSGPDHGPDGPLILTYRADGTRDRSGCQRYRLDPRPNGS